MKPQPPVKTLVVDNFRGMLTDYYFGDINSGRSWVQVVSGQNPVLKPGQLTWSEAPVQIDPTGAVITDLIMCGKERVESGILYVYAVGHTGKVYKIQVNNPSTYNPDYDNPVLLTTLALNTPTFTRGGFIEFYGATERMYIGHDAGVTQLDFNGSNETFVGSVGSWIQAVPRPIKQFQGSLYVGNGTNIAQIDTTLTVVTYAKLSPGFPGNSQARDIEPSIDSNYIEVIVSRLPLHDVTSATQQTQTTANVESYIFRWNGTDVGATSVSTFPSFSLQANTLFQDKQFTFGSDQFGIAVYDPTEKIFSVPEVQYVSPNAIRSTGNIMNFIASLYFQGFLQAVAYWWGFYDFEVGNPLGYWSPFFISATLPETDVNFVPFQLSVSNNGIGASSNGYTGNIFGTSKLYFSTLETSAAPTTKYRLYKWKMANSLQIPVSTNAINLGVYQTQTQLFSRKITVTEVRIYGEPWVTGNSFQIDLTGSTGNPLAVISGGTKVFTAGSTLTVGNDMAQYNPVMGTTYALGLSITNLGATNHVINKVEIDYVEAGK